MTFYLIMVLINFIVIYIFGLAIKWDDKLCLHSFMSALIWPISWIIAIIAGIKVIKEITDQNKGA